MGEFFAWLRKRAEMGLEGVNKVPFEHKGPDDPSDGKKNISEHLGYIERHTDA